MPEIERICFFNGKLLYVSRAILGLELFAVLYRVCDGSGLPDVRHNGC
jgi:hypothetical protein